MQRIEELVKKLSGQSKATLIVTEYVLNNMALPELNELLHFMTTTDLERVGLIELIRQDAEAKKLAPDTIDLLIGGLSGSSGSAAQPAEAPPPPKRARLQTITVRPVQAKPQSGSPKPPPPPPLYPGQGRRAPIRQPAGNLAPSETPEGHGQSSRKTNAIPKPEEHTFFGGSATGSFANLQSEDSKRKTILIADDDPRIRMVFRMRMEKTDYNVIEAASGDAAWKQIEKNPPDAMIMDMKMPGLHGLEILARLTSANQIIPVCVCSAYDQLKDEFVIKNYPVLRYFVKPVQAEEVVQAITELVDSAG